jgi:hypothetical protein
MSTFAQRERGGGGRRRRSSIPIPTTISTKTDLESIQYAPNDTAKIRKMKFIFRVKENLIKKKIFFFIVLFF